MADRSAGAGLAYVDLGTVLNTPESTTDGALEWMGAAHLLEFPGRFRRLPRRGHYSLCCGLDTLMSALTPLLESSNLAALTSHLRVMSKRGEDRLVGAGHPRVDVNPSS